MGLVDQDCVSTWSDMLCLGLHTGSGCRVTLHASLIQSPDLGLCASLTPPAMPVAVGWPCVPAWSGDTRPKLCVSPTHVLVWGHMLTLHVAPSTGVGLRPSVGSYPVCCIWGQALGPATDGFHVPALSSAESGVVHWVWLQSDPVLGAVSSSQESSHRSGNLVVGKGWLSPAAKFLDQWGALFHTHTCTPIFPDWFCGGRVHVLYKKIQYI